MSKLNPAGLRAAALSVLAVAAALALAPARGLAADAPVSDPRIVDLGAAVPGQVHTLNLTLALRNGAALETLVAALANPKSASYRQFITPAQFAASYGQTPQAVAQAVAFLKAQGFTVNRVSPNNLLVNITGTNAQLAATFGTSMHAYALGDETWTAPASAVVLPAALAGIATGLDSLSTRAAWRTHGAAVPDAGALANDLPGLVRASATLPASGPGAYTVRDLATQYDAGPVYAKGLTGAGRTLGILTLAGYQQADAFAYWNALGLATDPARITDIPVDGGPPRQSATSTAVMETTLDVQQAGGVAPGAAIRVYLAPNSMSGLLDVFSTAINENRADVISTSWGLGENYVSAVYRNAFHNLFLQAASQGVPLIAASGDNGAFDLAAAYPFPDCTTLLAVDFPAADPLVLAAGGTTLPYSVQHQYGTITVPAERPWGWDYLRSYIVGNYGSALYYADYYTVGGGGGVSVDYAVPTFQAGLAGVATSAPAQTLLCSAAFLYGAGTGYGVVTSLPAAYAGRNLPDVSLDADPFTGYSIYLNGQWVTGHGGTSFVAPQLNGILTLISSGLSGNGRLGAINPQLYALFRTQGYAAGSPFRPITTGDNEYYKAAARFNPATGLGTLDIGALATALGVQ